LRRTVLMLLECPVFFFYSFTWEAFALISTDYIGDDKFTFSYCLMTGVGAFAGSFLYSLMLLGVQYQMKEFDLNIHFSEGVLRAISGGVTTGTLWQFSVNISEINGFTFTEGFFFVFALSAVTFMLMTCLLRFCHSLLPREYQCALLPMSTSVFIFDGTLSLAVAASDAFFVGTDNDQYTGGWLTVFNVPDSGMAFGKSIALAGASGLCGFLVFQSIWNLIAPVGWNWVDGIPGSERKLNSAESSTQQQQPSRVLSEADEHSDERTNLLHDS
jgi:hypothetical protein